MFVNLRNAQWRWGVVTRVLKKTGATIQAWVMLYTAVVQTVKLYGRESWVVTYDILKVLEGFQHNVAQRIAGISDRRVGEGG